MGTQITELLPEAHQNWLTFGDHLTFARPYWLVIAVVLLALAIFETMAREIIHLREQLKDTRSERDAAQVALKDSTAQQQGGVFAIGGQAKVALSNVQIVTAPASASSGDGAARPEWYDDTEISHRSFRLTDLLPLGAMMLQHRRFRDCTIYGPAVLVALNDTGFIHSGFSGSGLASVYWPVEPDQRPEVVGVIVVGSCVFERCNLVQIGLAGPEVVRQKMIAGGLGAPAQDGSR